MMYLYVYIVAYIFNLLLHSCFNKLLNTFLIIKTLFSYVFHILTFPLRPNCLNKIIWFVGEYVYYFFKPNFSNS